MPRIKCIWVGRLQERFWQEAAEHYRRRLVPHVQLEEREIKDGPGKLPAVERSKAEGERILAAFKPGDVGILLDERGRELDSRGLAGFLGPFLEDGNRTPCLVVGGPFGVSEAVRRACVHTLCLGRLTLPHDLARVLLLEQIYRAVSIRKNLPYHHE